MKLYDSRKAPNPRRVRWVMAEKGIDDLEIVDVDIFKGEHRTTEYRGRAGMAHVPALELDDGTAITESLAISRYLETLYPEPNLFGHDARETAVIEMWTRRCEMYVSTPLMMAVRYGHPSMSGLEGAMSEEEIARQRSGAERMLKQVDRQLEGREFIAAERLTIADIIAVTGMDFARLIKWRPPAELENVGRWYEAMRARPAAQAGMTS